MNEAEVEREEAERKAKDKAHIAAVDLDILVDFMTIEAERDLSPNDVIKAIKTGKIRHVRIIY